MDSYDVIVVGGGMAGVSVGAELAADARVLVLDMEAALAFHTTGRSAAMFLESYGGPAIRALTTASRPFLADPPSGEQLLRRLPMLHVARPGRGAAARALHREVQALVPDVALLSAADAVELQPLLRPGRIELAVLEPDAMEIDVHALHQHYVRVLRAHRATIRTSARVVTARRHSTAWTVTTADGTDVSAPVLIDAAGAWADELARVAGAAPVGLRALRRSAFMVDAPPGAHPPMISELDEEFYVKPDAGALLCSPADETRQEPGDARPDATEIARAIEAINEMTTLAVRHVRSSWAGLRTFGADRTPVVGYDPAVEGFFWFAGQGGYGIQTAPALARTGAALVRGSSLPADVARLGLSAGELRPDRPVRWPGAD